MLERKPNLSIGTFNFAHSFWQAGSALRTGDWAKGVSHASKPVEFLYWHAIELFLKAFLLASGISETDLRKSTYGHNIRALAREATDRGLRLKDRDSEVLSLMQTKDDMIELRYITPGTRTVPEHEELETTCDNLYRVVGLALVEKGISLGHHEVSIKSRIVTEETTSPS